MSTNVIVGSIKESSFLQSLPSLLGAISLAVVATSAPHILVQTTQEGWQLDKAQKIAAHSDIRTTKLYDRTGDVISLEEIEQIRL